MKRAVFAASIILISIFSQGPASAATEGCPDTWSIDTSKFPNNPELIQAKQSLGPRMVESQVNQIITKYKGEQGDMPAFPELVKDEGILRFSYWYLYGKSEVETTWKVEVKDCPNPGIFKFKHLLSENKFTSVEKTAATNWANAHESSFTDFKKQQNFATELLQANTKSQELVDKRRPISSGRPSKLLTFQVFPLVNGSGNLFSNPSVYLSIQALTPNCLGPSSLLKGWSELVFGQKCKFAWTILERFEPNNPNNQDMKLVMFEPFEIDASFKSSTIACLKGKVIKKITGSNPKCPPGYKKK
jgi:hypothetical protein